MIHEKLQGVLLISGFYKNDVPGGVGTGLQFDKDPLAGISMCEDMVLNLRTYQNPVSLSKRLLTAGRRTEEDARRAIMDVYWLQEHGFIEPDEFNGSQFICIVENSIINTEENPVTIDWSRLDTGATDVTDILRASKNPMDRCTIASVRAVADHARKQAKTAVKIK